MAKHNLLPSQIRRQLIYVDVKRKILIELGQSQEMLAAGDALEASDARGRLCIRQAALSQHLVDTSPCTNVFLCIRNP